MKRKGPSILCHVSPSNLILNLIVIRFRETITAKWLMRTESQNEKMTFDPFLSYRAVSNMNQSTLCL